MTTSGVVTWNPEISDIVEQAGALAGVELRTGFDFRTARFALNTLFQEFANRGLNLWTLESMQQILVAGTETYTLPTGTVDTFEIAIRINPGVINTQSDVRINRISQSVYSAIPNKLVQGRPIQYMINRLVAPTITFWPVPDASTSWYALINYIRRIEDAGGNADNTLDAPTRFLPAIISGLAYQIALRKPDLIERVQMLKAEYEAQWDMAASEDREKAPVQLVPYIGPGGW
jgi:hypothetical protein